MTYPQLLLSPLYGYAKVGKMNQQNIIISILRDTYERNPDEWTRGFTLQGKPTPYGFLGARGTRNCRDLATEGVIESRIKNKFVEYRFNPAYRSKEQEMTEDEITKYAAGF